MVAETVQPGITEEDLLRLGAEDRLIEVINGEIVEMTPVGFLHHIITENVHEVLKTFVKLHRLGHVFMESRVEAKKPALLSSRDGYLWELTGWTQGSQAS